MSDTFRDSFSDPARDAALGERDSVRDCLDVLKRRSRARQGDVRDLYDEAIDRLQTLLIKLSDDLR